MSTSTLAARLQFLGGNQNNRITKQKLRSLQWAMKNDYQTRMIKTPYRTVWPALINFDQAGLKSDYDKKYVSVEYESGLEPGDVFECLDDGTHWMIYLPILTEKAYLHSQIIRCRYTLTIDDVEYWIYFQGPTETDLRWFQKRGINVNELNLSGTIYIKLNPQTRKFFERFTHIKVDNHVTVSSSTANLVRNNTNNVDIATFTKLLPINKTINVLSNFSLNCSAFLAPAFLSSTKTLILESFKDEKAVSLIEKNAENKTKTNIIIKTGTLNLAETDRGIKLLDCISNVLHSYCYALLEYLPVSVLTIISSPCSINIGTLTSKPVSTIASFKAFVLVSPLTAGSHWVTLRVTLSGKITPKISSPYFSIFTFSFSFKTCFSYSTRLWGISICS